MSRNISWQSVGSVLAGEEHFFDVMKELCCVCQVGDH